MEYDRYVNRAVFNLRIYDHLSPLLADEDPREQERERGEGD